MSIDQMASDEIHFDKAPIVEAVIGIDFEETLPVEVLDNLKKLGGDFGANYPTTENITKGEYKIQPGLPVSQTETPFGYFFKSVDGLQIVHARRNGFAFSRLHPYQTWKSFVDEAEHTWIFYRAIVGPTPLSKFTIRYINRLSWPNGENIEDYLAVYPHIPKELPQQVNGCFIRLDFPLTAPHQGKLTQQIASVPESQPDSVSFVLDNEFSFAAIGLKDSDVWESIRACQRLKNQIFLSSITEKMKGLIS
jgi:uncharacterized protein (TIGR04255 family)